MADLLEFEEPIAVLLKEIEALSMLPRTEDRNREIARLEKRIDSIRVDLYKNLSENLTVLTNARLRYVELGITLNPTSNGRFSPTVNDWNITYSCLANE